MTEKFIPVHDLRHVKRQSLIPAELSAANGQLLDQLARPLRDLRISVTDRCNFRCIYCMPKEVFHNSYQFLPHSSLLSFEEITRIARLFVAHGVRKIRLTGGEPLLRKNIEHLIEMLRAIPCADGKPLDISLTTNGSLLARKANALKQAGLDRVTVSLDAIDNACFKQMNDVDFHVEDVLNGIEAAHAAGLGPIKINMVVKAGLNDQEIVPMARHFQSTPHILRFIEYMDVGSSNGWKLDEVVTSAEIIRRLQAAGLALEPLAANYTGETAERWRYSDGHNEIGLISSVSKAFCHDCSRARLSTEGQLFTCLFATSGYDLRALLRSDQQHSDLEITSAIAAIWHQRNDRYSELRSSQSTSTLAMSKTIEKKIEMSYIGG